MYAVIAWLTIAEVFEVGAAAFILVLLAFIIEKVRQHWLSRRG